LAYGKAIINWDGRDMMRDVYLVAAVRTPVGKRGGGLSEAHPVDLGAHVLRELTNRTGIELVDEAIFGCVDQIGAQSYTLRDREVQRGLVAICEGGGTANAMLIERV
jgi:acetyl-CoA acetyltransferase